MLFFFISNDKDHTAKLGRIFYLEHKLLNAAHLRGKVECARVCWVQAICLLYGVEGYPLFRSF